MIILNTTQIDKNIVYNNHLGKITNIRTNNFKHAHFKQIADIEFINSYINTHAEIVVGAILAFNFNEDIPNLVEI